MGQGDTEGLGFSVTCASDEKLTSALEAFQAEGFAALNSILCARLGLLSTGQILATPETSGDSILHRCVVMDPDRDVSMWSCVH